MIRRAEERLAYLPMVLEKKKGAAPLGGDSARYLIFNSCIWSSGTENFRKLFVNVENIIIDQDKI
jgi:hypothetical protein